MTDLREQSGRPHEGSFPKSYRVERVTIGECDPPQRRQAAEKLLGLTQAIQREVVPRLVVAHAIPEELHSDLREAFGATTSEDVAVLADQMLTGDTSGASARIELLRGQGLTLETIYLKLLAPAAIHLRRLWSSDLCGFAEATLALWRLQQLVRQYSVEFRAEAEQLETGRRVLLAPTPREKHDLSYAMFALVLMSEFFRRDGWESWIEPDPTSQEFARVVHDEWFDVVEFLVSGDKQLDALASRIRMIRRESPNRSIGIIVYGQVFIEHPELVLLVGADLAALDARQGALQAQHLVGLTERS
jgi:hypothetical protein